MNDAIGGGLVAAVFTAVLAWLANYLKDKHSQNRELRKDTLDEFSGLLNEVKEELEEVRKENREILSQLADCRRGHADERARRKYVEFVLKQNGIRLEDDMDSITGLPTVNPEVKSPEKKGESK
jgi:hypothetical protein